MDRSCPRKRSGGRRTNARVAARPSRHQRPPQRGSTPDGAAPRRRWSRAAALVARRGGSSRAGTADGVRARGLSEVTAACESSAGARADRLDFDEPIASPRCEHDLFDDAGTGRTGDPVAVRGRRLVLSHPLRTLADGTSPSCGDRVGRRARHRRRLQLPGRHRCGADAGPARPGRREARTRRVPHLRRRACDRVPRCRAAARRRLLLLLSPGGSSRPRRPPRARGRRGRVGATAVAFGSYAATISGGGLPTRSIRGWAPRPTPAPAECSSPARGARDRRRARRGLACVAHALVAAAAAVASVVAVATFPASGTRRRVSPSALWVAIGVVHTAAG
jgi:hypothetical protein